MYKISPGSFNFEVFKTLQYFGIVIANVDGILHNLEQEQSELLKKFRFYKLFDQARTSGKINMHQKI